MAMEPVFIAFKVIVYESLLFWWGLLHEEFYLNSIMGNTSLEMASRWRLLNRPDFPQAAKLLIGRWSLHPCSSIGGSPMVAVPCCPGTQQTQPPVLLDPQALCLQFCASFLRLFQNMLFILRRFLMRRKGLIKLVIFWKLRTCSIGYILTPLSMPTSESLPCNVSFFIFIPSLPRSFSQSLSICFLKLLTNTPLWGCTLGV